MKRIWKKGIALAVALALTFALGISVSFANNVKTAPTYTDVPEDYWGYAAITQWSTDQYNILRGYGDGKFGPEDPITAEQLALMNGRILGIDDADVSYTGSGSRVLTRAEAITIIAQTFQIDPVESTSNTFADNASIPAQYRGYVNALKAKGYIHGMGGNYFAPNSTYKRSEALQVVFNMMTDITDENATGVNAEKDYVIRSAGVRLKDATINGDLIIGQGVGDGEVTLDNVTVKGKLLVFGGGSNSIVVRGKSNIANVEIFKSTGQAVRIKAEGAAVVGTVTVSDGSNAIVNGAVTTVVIGEKTTVNFQNARVTNVQANGADSTLNVDANSTIKTVTISVSNVKVLGTGKVEKAVVTADAKSGVVLATKGTVVSVDKGAGAVTDASGKVIAKSGQTTTLPGSSSGSSSSGGGSSSGGNGGNTGSGSGRRS